MSTRNPNWFNLQSQRGYPLVDSATGTGDGGERLPGDILVDCQLRWPATLGKYAFVGGVTVTPRLVTVVLLATDSPESATDFTPLAAVTLPQPVDEYRPYDLVPMTAGVAGFIAFGNVGDAFSARFSTPQQSLLASRCARAYRPLPVPTLRKLGCAVGLDDIVSLVAGIDTSITPEIVHIEDIGARPALVFRLVQDLSDHNVLDTYRGPCDTRAESHTCKRDGIEEINGVTPDDNGNLTLVITGIPTGVFANPPAGLVLESTTELADVCLPNVPGVLVGEDTCVSSEFLCNVLPFTEIFSDGRPADFLVKRGQFTHEIDAYAASHNTHRNVAIWLGEDCVSLGTFNRACTVALKLTDHATDPENPCVFTQVNGGIVINFRIVDPLTDPHQDYFMVDLDRPSSKLRLRHWLGAGWSPGETIEVSIGALDLDTTYILTATVVPTLTPGFATIHVRLETGTVTFSTVVAYGPDEGYFGVGSDSAYTRFQSFHVEEFYV